MSAHATPDPQPRRLTITQAGSHLAEVVHDVERHGPVELTEGGKAVAVIVALDEYRRLADSERDTWSAYQRFRAETVGENGQDLDVDALLEGTRDRSPGRDPLV